MAYDIPKNLTKYAEEFLFGLSLKQFIFALVSIGSSFILYTYLSGNMSSWIIGLIISPILILGAMFVFFDLEGKIKAQMNLKSSLYKASYFDSNVNSFIDVSEIKENVVALKDGTILGIVEVKPIDFFILSSEEKQKVLNAYRGWLKSIDYYVQVLSRSVHVDLEKWLNNLKKKSIDKKRINVFSDWLEEEITKSNVRNRIFYLIIPEKPEMAKTNAMEDMKSIFTGNYTFNNPDFESQKKHLQNDITNCIETLDKCGLKIRRLKTDELLGLYSSYFLNQSKVNKTVLAPIIGLEEGLMEEHDEMYKRVKNERTKQIAYQRN